MALKGLDIFKLTPKTNCKECGNPTCMAFAMKVASGALTIDKCPHMSAEALASLSAATEPPMKTITLGEYKLGGETVLMRHDKTFVSKSLYSVHVCNAAPAEYNDGVLADLEVVDYDRIGERMHAELIHVNYVPGCPDDYYLDLVKRSAATGRALILNTSMELAEQAIALCGDAAYALQGANAENYEAYSALATAKKCPLVVGAANLDELHDVVEKLEAAGNKNLILDVTFDSAAAAFEGAVEVRRAALKGNDRTFGYPSFVDLTRLARGDKNMQCALAALFTAKYGSIIVLDLDYASALPLFGLRQNIFTDPQKPMKVEPGIYPLNGADENSICMTTVDFALTYFVVSGEIERSGVPVNLLISDAGGYSVLTAWAAGKLSASSIAKFIEEQGIENKIKNRTLVLPGKVAVLKGELQEKLPNWKVVVGTREAIELVKFLREYQD